MRRAIFQNAVIAVTLVVAVIAGVYLGNWIADLTPWIN